MPNCKIWARDDGVFRPLGYMPLHILLLQIRGWDHLDFLWGKEAPSLLYPDIVDYIKENESPKKRAPEKRNTNFRHIRGVDDEL